jgi:hypothetical protein
MWSSGLAASGACHGGRKVGRVRIGGSGDDGNGWRSCELGWEVGGGDRHGRNGPNRRTRLGVWSVEGMARWLECLRLCLSSLGEG